MTGSHITLLAEDFQALVRAADPEQRYPALEQVLTKGNTRHIESVTANHLRLSLFGMDPQNDFPVAALTHLADGSTEHPGKHYWLRADPVTMRADVAQVFLTNYGFADLNEDERKAIENCVQQVLFEEGIDAGLSQFGHWCMALNEPLDFQFTTLDQALGMDVADALPEHTAARNWRRLLNEIQVALHHCPVNIRRRHGGQQEINSLWFWGGGYMPLPSPQNQIEGVYSNQSVSRGLAILNRCRLETLEQSTLDDRIEYGHDWLIDWLPVTASAPLELDKLETLVQSLINRVQQANLAFTLFDGHGHGWRFDRSARRRFWKRASPLAALLTVPDRS